MGSHRFNKIVNTYEEGKKKELVTLGQSKKPYKDILVYLANEIKKSRQNTSFNYKIKCWKEDGAYQLNKAIEEVYGASINKGEETPSNGEQPVEMLDVKLSNGDRIKVPFGAIATPDFGEGSSIYIGYQDQTNQLHVEGVCQFQYASLMDQIINRTTELLNTESIYRQQALEIDADFKPKTMNLSNIDKEFMILSASTEFSLRPLKGRILHPETCIAKGVPLKYGVLLEGVYGTGKTLLAFKIAAEAIQNGWTFIYLKDPNLLARTLQLSKILDNNGHGVIVFVEDIDQVTRGNRDAAMQDILNTLDGGDTKNMNVIAMFSTNHIELIEPTFLRGKRIGSIISLTTLDADTAEKFLRFSFEKDEEYSLEDDLAAVCQYIAENNIAPAFMAEIVESLKSHMIFMETTTVTASDIKHAVDGYLRQVGLSRKKDMSVTPEQKFAEGFGEMITGKMMTTKIRTEVDASIKELEARL